MNVLKEVVNSLSREEVKHIKFLLGRTKKDAKRKDIILFDSIRKQAENYDEDKVLKKLYSNSNKNAFHGLKSKLLSDINKGLFFLHADDNQKLKTSTYIAVAKFFEERNKLELALYFLNKAEKISHTQEYFELLEIIITQKIKLSEFDLNLNPEELINKRNEVQEKLRRIQEIDDIVAIAKHRIRVSCNHASKSDELSQQLEKAITGYTDEPLLKDSSQLRFRLYNAISSLLLQNHNYENLIAYIEKTLHQFSKEKLFTKENHATKLQMITYLINSYFKLGKYEDSIEKSNLLKDEMLKHNKLHFSKYLIFYYNSLFINYSKIDSKKAIEMLNEWKHDKDLQRSPYYPTFIYFNLTLLYYEQKSFENAIKSINNLFHHPGFQDIAYELRFKIRINELIIRYEIGDLDFLEIKIDQLKKDFQQLLIEEDYQREKEFIEILEMMSQSRHWEKNKSLIESMKTFNARRKRKAINSEFIEYSTWLKEKLQKKNLAA